MNSIKRSKFSKLLTLSVFVFIIVLVFSISFIPPEKEQSTTSEGVKPSESPASESSKPTENSEELKTPTPSETPKPSETAESTDKAESSETPKPDKSKGSEQSIELKLPLTLEAIVDENGFLKDEILLNLKEMPYDGDKYSEIQDLGNGKNSIKLYTSPIKYKDEKGKYKTINGIKQLTIV